MERAKLKLIEDMKYFDAIVDNWPSNVVFNYLIADKETKIAAFEELRTMIKDFMLEDDERYWPGSTDFLSLFGPAVARAADWRCEHGLNPCAKQLFQKLLCISYVVWAEL